jgi:hypothetical protein
MTTYNTYQEAKIANPECEIYQLERNELFVHCNCHKAELVGFDEFSSIGVKCNPADYCMTVERFLADGHELVEGDLYINVGGFTTELTERKINSLMSRDTSRRFILRAAALEDKKPRTKVEYVKIEEDDSIFDMAVELYENALFSIDSDGWYVGVFTERQLTEAHSTNNLYRKASDEDLLRIELYSAINEYEVKPSIAELIAVELASSGKFKLVS